MRGPVHFLFKLGQIDVFDSALAVNFFPGLSGYDAQFDLHASERRFDIQPALHCRLIAEYLSHAIGPELIPKQDTINDISSHFHSPAFLRCYLIRRLLRSQARKSSIQVRISATLSRFTTSPCKPSRLLAG